MNAISELKIQQLLVKQSEVIELTREDIRNIYLKWTLEERENPASFSDKSKYSTVDEYVEGCTRTFLEYLQEVKK